MRKFTFATVVIVGCEIARTNFAGAQPAPVAATPPPPAAQAAPQAPATEPAKPVETSAESPAPSTTTLTQGIRGVLTDESTGIGLSGATITVVGPNGTTTTTDLEGNYILDLPPGTYTVNFFTPLFDSKTQTAVVTAKQVTDISVALAPSEAANEVIEVRGKIDTRNESATLAQRRAATVVSDAVSAQEISRTTAATANEAMKRVVSVSVLDGKYIALRGLEGRYVTTLLNGIVLPSTEPDRNAVPLDLFPTSLLANLTVYKSYGAELPGQFGGGTLAIDTNSFPTAFEAKVSLSTSANTATIGQRGLFSGVGGAAGFFGFDTGRRQLPTDVPTAAALRGMPDGEMTSIGRSFRNDWTASDSTVSPNFAVNATVGDSKKLARRPLGYLVSAMLRHGYTGKAGQSQRTSIIGGELSPTDSLNYNVGEQEATVGTLANVGYSVADGHDINLFALYSHVGTDMASQGGGFSEADATNIEASRLSFVERGLAMVQMVGKHRMPKAHGLEVRWQLNTARTHRDELDSRDLTYNIDPSSGTMSYKDQPGSGQRYWSFLSDRSTGGGFDAMLPAGNLRFRAGATLQMTDRGFRGRRFRYRYIGDDSSVRTMSPNQIFDSANIGTAFQVQEDTLHEDSYEATLSVAGAYTVAELEATSKLKLIAGARFERSQQTLQNGSRYAIAGIRANLDRVDNDPLPTANAVYALTSNSNLRAAYSYTLARPRFRELAPFLYFDYVRRRSLSGNPELRTTHIHNVDARWEMFPADDEVVAVSGFYKQFSDPIEQVLADSESNATFRNATAASLAGVEIEARVGLGRFGNIWRGFYLAGNAALMRSQVTLPADNMILTSAQRPLYGQSPYVANASVEYRSDSIANIGVLYNVSGRRIGDVGVEGLPDTYEEAFHRIDVVLSRKLGSQLRGKLSAANILNQSVRLTQGGVTVDRFTPGVSMSVSLEWAPK
jgi:hypothetical protein